VLLAALFLGAGQYGTDQMIVQRYLTTKSPEAARKTLWFNAIFMMPFTVLIYLLGLMLFAFYHSHPELAAGLVKPDRVVPYFIVHEVPGNIRAYCRRHTRGYNVEHELRTQFVVHCNRHRLLPPRAKEQSA